MGTKVCKVCGKEKDVSEFYLTRKVILRPYCKMCYSAKNKEYYENNYLKIKVVQKALYENKKPKIFDYLRQWRKRNPEKVKEYEKKSRDNHKKEKTIWTMNRRAKIKNSEGSFTRREWIDLLKKYENKCLCCGTSERLEPDHVMPIALGGANTIENIQPLCRSCNSRKNAKYIDYRKEKK